MNSININNDILKYALENDMIDLSYIQEQVEMKKREKYLKMHPYNVWKGKNGKWYTYLPNDNGGRILKKRTSENDILNLIADYYAKKSSKAQQIEQMQDVEEHKFKNVYRMWKEKQIKYGISSNTETKYEYDYRRYFEGKEFEEMDIREMTEEDITIFVISTIRELNLKEKAGKALWGYISGTFKSARINKLIEDNPCNYIDTKSFFKFYDKSQPSPESRVVPNNDIQKLLEQLKKDHEQKPEYIPSYAVELSLYTGMRPGELSGLQWDDVRLDERIIIIRHSEKYIVKENRYYLSETKTHKTRQFPISDDLMEFFKKIKYVQEIYGRFGNYVFSTANGNIHCRTMESCMRNKFIQLGINPKSISAVRRTFNSKMKCEGVPTAVAASLLGHTQEVNESNYTYDISGMNYKRNVVSKINHEMTQLV